MNNTKPIYTSYRTIPANSGIGCGDRRCHNGWYRYAGSDYPCGACSERAKIEAKQRQRAASYVKNFDVNLF